LFDSFICQIVKKAIYNTMLSFFKFVAFFEEYIKSIYAVWIRNLNNHEESGKH